MPIVNIYNKVDMVRKVDGSQDADTVGILHSLKCYFIFISMFYIFNMLEKTVSVIEATNKILFYAI